MIVVFSGYNQRAVISFLRTLEKNRINYKIIAAHSHDSIFMTSYRKNVVFTRKYVPLVLEDILFGIRKVKSFCNDGESMFIAPSSEALNRFLLQHRVIFEEEKCIMPLPSQNLYEKISDKESFTQLCSQYGIPVPPIIDITNGFVEPIIAKPKQYIASDARTYSPEFILNKEQFTNFLQKHKVDDFIYQKYLFPGLSYYLLFYFSRDGKVYSTSQKNLAQQHNGKHILAAITHDIHKEIAISGSYIDLLRKEKYHGLIMIEIRQFQDTYYMIEANPRFWGPSQLFCDANYNLFEFMLKDYCLLNSNIETNEQQQFACYYWSGGFDNLNFETDCVWYGEGENTFKKQKDIFIKSDIYCKEDTVDIYYSEKLHNLYQKVSKHSNYQILPDSLYEYIDPKDLNVVSRYEKERMEYISKHVNIKNKTILDIGGNTGYFTIESVENGAQHVDYYEGNANHAEFVKTASEALKITNYITVNNKYYMFDNTIGKNDICYCLNVIHHLGDDFGNEIDKINALDKMMDCVNNMSSCVKTLILQMGFNWKGDRNQCLFPNGTKREMIDFLRNNTRNNWNIVSIGIAEGEKGKITYKELNDANISRRDDLGEFLNRPLFILSSKTFQL